MPGSPTRYSKQVRSMVWQELPCFCNQGSRRAEGDQEAEGAEETGGVDGSRHQASCLDPKP